MTSVTAYFHSFDDADRAVTKLLSDGAAREDLSIVANQSHDKQRTSSGVETTGVEAGATTGVVFGGALGVAIGLGALVVPGIGPLLAAGPLAAALAGGAAGAAAGGVAGGLLGALADLGVPKNKAEHYVEGVKKGGVLVTLRQADDVDAVRAERIFRDAGADDVFIGQSTSALGTPAMRSSTGRTGYDDTTTSGGFRS